MRAGNLVGVLDSHPWVSSIPSGCPRFPSSIPIVGVLDSHVSARCGPVGVLDFPRFPIYFSVGVLDFSRFLAVGVLDFARFLRSVSSISPILVLIAIEHRQHGLPLKLAELVGRAYSVPLAGDSPVTLAEDWATPALLATGRQTDLYADLVKGGVAGALAPQAAPGLPTTPHRPAPAKPCGRVEAPLKKWHHVQIAGHSTGRVTGRLHAFRVY